MKINLYYISDFIIDKYEQLVNHIYKPIINIWSFLNSNKDCASKPLQFYSIVQLQDSKTSSWALNVNKLLSIFWKQHPMHPFNRNPITPFHRLESVVSQEIPAHKNPNNNLEILISQESPAFQKICERVKENPLLPTNEKRSVVAILSYANEKYGIESKESFILHALAAKHYLNKAEDVPQAAFYYEYICTDTVMAQSILCREDLLTLVSMYEARNMQSEAVKWLNNLNKLFPPN